ncbi:hypothetical protein QTO30_20060 [Yoonia sp. GPGPB17]|uniref:hypothetical protein n=1 Tax=Yoonia sp. GPGPB17 TaxID=3026147 RepID=UPI0030BD9589
MNEFIKHILELENEELTYDQFAELHEIWRVVSEVYFTQISNKGDILNAAGWLERQTNKPS